MFCPRSVTISHKDLRGAISPGLLISIQDISAHKQRIIRDVLYNEAYTLFIGRFTALSATGYKSERQMYSIDRLKNNFRVLKQQPDMYDFLNYINESILPSLVSLTPGPESRFINYKPQLDELIKECETQQEHFTKEFQRAFNYISANQAFSKLMKEHRQQVATT